jgi:hypothetical protein
MYTTSKLALYMQLKITVFHSAGFVILSFPRDYLYATSLLPHQDDRIFLVLNYQCSFLTSLTVFRWNQTIHASWLGNQTNPPIYL